MNGVRVFAACTAGGMLWSHRDGVRTEEYCESAGARHKRHLRIGLPLVWFEAQCQRVQFERFLRAGVAPENFG